MDFDDKKFIVPRSSSREEFIKSLDESIYSFNIMRKALKKQKMIIDIENIPSDAFDLSSISTTYNVYVEQLMKIFNSKKYVEVLKDYANLLEEKISKSKMNDTAKILQKYTQEMNVLQKNNQKLKNITIKLSEETPNEKKTLKQANEAHKSLKQVCGKYKKSLAKNKSITPMTFKHILSINSTKGLFAKLKNIKFKIEEIIKVCCMNKHTELKKCGFFSKVINSVKRLGRYFSRKYRIHKIFNYIQKNEKGIAKSIEKITNFFKTIKKNYESLQVKATGSFDRNFTYSNLKEIFRNIKYRMDNIYSNPNMSKQKNVKNMISEALKSNSMPVSKSEKDIFSCMICVKMINYLFIILNSKDNLGDIKNLSQIKFKKIVNLRNVFEIFKLAITILSIIVTIASYVLPLVGVAGTPLWGSLLTINGL